MAKKDEMSYEEAYYKATHSFVKNGKDIIIDLFHSSQQFMVIDKRIPELLVKRIDELEKEIKNVQKSQKMAHKM